MCKELPVRSLGMVMQVRGGDDIQSRDIGQALQRLSVGKEEWSCKDWVLRHSSVHTQKGGWGWGKTGSLSSGILQRKRFKVGGGGDCPRLPLEKTWYRTTYRRCFPLSKCMCAYLCLTLPRTFLGIPEKLDICILCGGILGQETFPV